MKKLVLALALLPLFAWNLSAQVSVEVLMSQGQYVANEAIPVKVRVVNHSGQTLLFGQEDWLSFSVEARDGLVVLKSGEPPQPHDFNIRSAEMATTPRTDLAPYFLIARPGRYSVTATIRIKDWDKALVSKPVFFDVVQGVRIWEQEFGIPQSPTNHNEPEVRKYILQQATMSRSMKLYFRLTDAMETKTFKVTPVGPMISFSDPQTRIDQDSNLHLLYQDAARKYNYFVFNTDGDLRVRQTYVYTDSAPHLRMDDNGKVVIFGGARYVSDTDIPTSRPSLTNVIPPPVR
ncbi:MAG TPA: hypothetical protein VFB72_15865 [Verrucomicrobiae bacterium]|nr:hypothetical protein [Verrucomicrobiae bacterium]